MNDRRPLLDVLRRNPLFRKLWTAQLISQTGDWLSRTAVLGLLSSLGARDAMVGVGALYAAELATRLLPSALLYPLAGPAADRLPRRFLMVGADFLRVLIVLGLLAVKEPSDLPLLYGLVMAQVGLGTFFASAQSAAIPSIVDKDELQDAYAVSSATWSFTLSLGAALGGLSVRYLGTQGAIVVDALTYVVSASLLLRLRLPEVEKHPQPFRLRDILLFTDIRRGLAHARERGTGAILLAKSLWGGAGGFLVALSLLSRQRFAASGPDGNPAPESVALIVGLFYAARGLGTGAGPVIARRFLGSNDKDLRRQIRLGFALGALGYALIPLTSSFGAALACVALSHSGGSILWVASTTFWQRKVDNAYRGRVFALEFLGMTLSFALGGLAAALVFDATQDLKRTLWTSVSLVALGGLLWSWIDADRRKLPDTTPSE
ncbi:MAG: putative MFS family arabinose efflux permease [Planctomycetota bacterium]